MDLDTIKKFVMENRKGIVVGFVAALLVRSLLK